VLVPVPVRLVLFLSEVPEGSRKQPPPDRIFFRI
jgi:hypothetical protein